MENFKIKSVLLSLLTLACSLVGLYAARHSLQQNQARERAAQSVQAR